MHMVKENLSTGVFRFSIAVARQRKVQLKMFVPENGDSQGT
jgi:hypothetical protein